MNSSSRISLYVAAFLSLFTALGHTVGTFSDVPAEEVALRQLYVEMSQTLIKMPVGAKKSMADVFLGNNLCVSLMLVVAAVTLVTQARAAHPSRAVLLTQALLLLGTFAISAMFFFPVPAFTTGLAGLLTARATLSQRGAGHQEQES